VVHGEMDEGERLAREGAQLAAALGMGTARLWLETTAAAAAARDGDGDTAPLERLRGRGLGASQTVNVLNTLTHCRLSTGHPAGGLAAADEALALAERAGLAHSLGPAPAVNRVEALYRLGRWDEAGAAPLARRIARRAGRAGLTGPSGGPLTARESEVLQLLARGRSNREIGRGAVHLAEDRQRPRLAHPRQARRLLPGRGRRRGPGPRPGVTGRPGARLGRRACEPPGAAHCRMASGGRCKRQGAAAGSGTRTRPGTVARTRGAFSARQTVVRRRAGRRRCARPRPPRRPRAPATPPRRSGCGRGRGTAARRPGTCGPRPTARRCTRRTAGRSPAGRRRLRAAPSPPPPRAPTRPRSAQRPGWRPGSPTRAARGRSPARPGGAAPAPSRRTARESRTPW